MQMPKWEILVMLCEEKHPRYINGKEIPNWQQGPSILEALEHLGWKGWEIASDPSALWRGSGKLVLRRPSRVMGLRSISFPFTIALGKRVREARLEAKMSQAELAEKAYFKQLSISKLESGNKGVAAEDILYLSAALDKPVIYFFPKEFRDEFNNEEQNEELQEFLMLTKKMTRSELQRAMKVVKALTGDS